MIYNHTGFQDESVAHRKRELELEPTDVANPLGGIALALLHKGEPEKALPFFEKWPGGGFAAVYRQSQYAWTLFAVGRTDDADKKVKDLLKEHPDDKAGELTGMMAVLLAATGDMTGAEKQIQNALKKQSGFSEFHHTSYFIAAAYARMNNVAEALYWLRKTADTGFPCYSLFATDPNLDSLRGNTNFVSFLHEQKRDWQRRSNLWFKADAAVK